jgi:hypothetical protein
MARNEVFRDADHLSLPVPADTAAGVAVLVGGADGLKGVTETPEGQGGNADGFATVWLKSSAVLPVTGAVTAIGQPIYIPPTGGALTTTATNNVKWGNALALKGAGTAPLHVRVARA